MENLFSLIPFIIIPIVLASFAYFYFGGKNKLPIESGVVPVFQEQAGGRFNGFNLTIPFVRHAVYEGFIVIAYGKTRFKLAFEEIDKVELKRHLFSKGITYHHRSNEVPSSCIVWSTDSDRVIAFLKNNGLNVV
tara:strand:+ start:818 stop:1219 length:402 start_codon:yes stop_codon:yes gene_type:complete